MTQLTTIEQILAEGFDPAYVVFALPDWEHFHPTDLPAPIAEWIGSSGEEVMRPVGIDDLGKAMSKYMNFFKVPFPLMPIRDLSEGRMSRRLLFDRIMQAVSTQRADPEWENMYPSPGTIEDRLYYQPMLKALAKRS